MESTEAHMPPTMRKQPRAIMNILSSCKATCFGVLEDLSDGFSQKNMHAGKMRQNVLPNAAPITPSSELKKGMLSAMENATRPQKATLPL